ncbi:MAG: hypothetical protein BWK80_62480 [Desulfobacteraceae bacterium IS3]|nr:MAG: hypothetical protein BWK80_62480 [Desulfobacteraceae bacterium IS3]
MEFPHRKNEPQSYAKFPAKLRKGLKHIFAELCVFLCETLRFKKMNRKERKVAQRFKTYLCGTLRLPLRNSAVQRAQSCAKV